MKATSRYRVLILTDHRIHSPVESIYSIARGLAQAVECVHVHVVSRGIEGNQSFFDFPENHPLRATVVDDNFQYTAKAKCFHERNIKVFPLDYDVVFLRMPRASSMEFFNKVGNLIPPERIINQPGGIARTGSKEYLLNFPEVCPPMRYCNSLKDVTAFREQYPMVLKPLNSSGGKGIVRIDGNRVLVGQQEFSWTEYLPTLAGNIGQGYLAMKFLKNVHLGDKRIIVINQQIVAAALRIPQTGSWLCNVSMGASSVLAEPDANEIRIAKRIIPDLFAQGVVMFGFDTLVDDDGNRVLSELNTSCVNGIYPADLISDKPVVKNTVNLLWEYIKTTITTNK